jgi:hypothetical protein
MLWMLILIVFPTMIYQMTHLGSTSNTQQSLKSHAELYVRNNRNFDGYHDYRSLVLFMDHKMNIFHKEMNGVGLNRNLIKFALGEYYSFLNKAEAELKKLESRLVEDLEKAIGKVVPCVQSNNSDWKVFYQFRQLLDQKLKEYQILLV